MSTNSETGATSSREKHKLSTSDVSSLFELKGELYRKKAEQSRKSECQPVPSTSKKNVLLMTKKEEKSRLEESKQRQSKIQKLEREIREEEEERRRVQEILEEKSSIYNRLSGGETLSYGDGQSVEFLVDFNAKKREEEEWRKKELEESNKLDAEAVHFVPTEEQRVYGTTHVPFSLNEEKRREEMNELMNLSKITEANREKRKKFLEQREKIRLERINKIRRRKGLEEITIETPAPDSLEAVQFIDIPLPPEPKATEAKKPRVGIREWDRGKVAYSNWISAQRDVRNEEFRPPSSYLR